MNKDKIISVQFEQRIFSITLPNERKRVVEGPASAHFGVHQCLNTPHPLTTGTYAITHLMTGCEIHRFHTLLQAKELVRRLEQPDLFPIGWGSVRTREDAQANHDKTWGVIQAVKRQFYTEGQFKGRYHK